MATTPSLSTAPHAPAEIKTWLDEQLLRFNTPSFLVDDPISIPHLFTDKEDIEIAAFLVAVLAWGQRKTILANGNKLMALMDYQPSEFIRRSGPKHWRPLKTFVHRTFNGEDCLYLVQRLQLIYQTEGGLEGVVSGGVKANDEHIGGGLVALRAAFFPAQGVRTAKHLPDVSTGSAAKRMNMFLRWMVRNDSSGVDFGLWKSIRPNQLVCPLDLHTGRVARALGLLKRPQNDWKAALELTEQLKQWDPADPVKYDIALFGMGAAGVLKSKA